MNVIINFTATTNSEQEVSDYLNSMIKHGELDTFIVTHEKIEVKVTTGFSNMGSKPFDLAQSIHRKFKGFSTVDKWEVKENLFHLILTPTKENDNTGL